MGLSTSAATLPSRSTIEEGAMKMTSLHAFAFIAIAVCGSGCMKRTLLTFEDHPKQAFTAVEVLEEKNYWITRTAEHRFLMCKDAGNQLVCARSCGNAKDVQCPMGALTTLTRSTNVR
jgi:hypothetical protein